MVKADWTPKAAKSFHNTSHNQLLDGAYNVFLFLQFKAVFAQFLDNFRKVCLEYFHSCPFFLCNTWKESLILTHWHYWLYSVWFRWGSWLGRTRDRPDTVEPVAGSEFTEMLAGLFSAQSNLSYHNPTSHWLCTNKLTNLLVFNLTAWDISVLTCTSV